jgi:hypothetical protein
MFTDCELRERQHAVVNAVASQRLEGLEPDPRTVADLERAAAGELDISDVLRILKERIASGEFHVTPAK